MTRNAALLLGLLAAACGDEPAPVDAGHDAAVAIDAGADGAVPPIDGALPDAAMADAATGDAGASDAGASDAATLDAGPEPTDVLWPVPGELTFIQLRLPGLIRLGEAGVLVGPDGTLVLMDIGNSSHEEVVRELVRTLNTTWITRARGFPREREPLEVDFVVISHVHSDHAGAFADLFGGPTPLRITGGLVHRGFVDVGDAMNTSDYEDLCDALSGSLAAVDVPLCRAAAPAPCDPGSFAGAHPATSCDGLFRGDVADASDDALGAPSYIALGSGARMVFVAADGFVSDGVTATPITPAFGHSDSNEENARSVVAVVEHGSFRYHWGGDLTGSGDPGEPDVESHLVRVAGAAFYGALGVDVIHAHHHVRSTSSNAAFVAATAPLDGRSRNVIGGINGGHVGSPHGEVLERFADASRLGDGFVWITMSATGGDSHPRLIDADADVIVQTLGGGAAYRVQAARSTPLSHAYTTVR